MNEEENIESPEVSSSPFSEGVLRTRRLGGAASSFRNRSDAAQEIISRQPGFVEKWALMVFFFILLILMAGTWFIRYPDIIETRGNLTSDNAPKEIMALQSGRIINLFVKNGSSVTKGNMIAWIESSANTNEVLNLSQKLNSCIALLQLEKSEDVSKLFKNQYQNLGEIQTTYQTFITALQHYNDYLVNGFYVRKKAMLVNDMGALHNMNQSIEQQKDLTQQDEDLSKKSFEMNEKLYKEKVISADEYRTEKSKLVNKQMSIPQLNASILSNQNQQRDKLKELEQLEHDVRQQKTLFVQALQTLKSSVDAWVRTYTIQAPIDGTIFFTLPLQQNKFIDQGKLLGYINPPDSKFYAELYLPQNNLGKVDTGMQVQLRFDAYPYQEFGFIKGRLNYISKISSDSGFYATVSLQNGLKTNLKNAIQYKNGLKAEAIIITKNMRLLQRLYYSVVKATSVGK
ncbi:MAG: HlyD family efflux transporter periplasmic adaptor subunit [Ferruginibacter sp.]